MRRLWDAVRPYATGGLYVNFLGNEDDALVRAAYGNKYERLAQIKAMYEP